MSNSTDFLRQLAAMSPEEKRAAQAILGGASPPSDTPKISRALDQVAESDVDKVCTACAQAVAFLATNPGKFSEAVQIVAQVSPTVAAAISANADYRKHRPAAHSFQVAHDYLLSDVAEQRRAAASKAARKARIASAAAAPASAETGKAK